MVCIEVKNHYLNAMSLTNRSSGLVQRKTATVQHVGADGGAEERDDEGYTPDEEEDHESKETRLTLMEEILLLGLKDREVQISLE